MNPILDQRLYALSEVTGDTGFIETSTNLQTNLTQRHNSKDTPPHDLNRVNFENKQVYQTTPNNKQTNNQATRHKRKIIILSLEHLSCKRNIVFLSWNIALLHKKKLFLSL